MQLDAKGQLQTHTFDAIGRQTGTQYADGTRFTVTFDALGRALTQQNPHGTWTSTYDAVGRAVIERRPNVLSCPSSPSSTWRAASAGIPAKVPAAEATP